MIKFKIATLLKIKSFSFFFSSLRTLRFYDFNCLAMISARDNILENASNILLLYLVCVLEFEFLQEE